MDSVLEFVKGKTSSFYAFIAGQGLIMYFTNYNSTLLAIGLAALSTAVWQALIFFICWVSHKWVNRKFEDNYKQIKIKVKYFPRFTVWCALVGIGVSCLLQHFEWCKENYGEWVHYSVYVLFVLAYVVPSLCTMSEKVTPKKSI